MNRVRGMMCTGITPWRGRFLASVGRWWRRCPTGASHITRLMSSVRCRAWVLGTQFLEKPRESEPRRPRSWPCSTRGSGGDLLLIGQPGRAVAAAACSSSSGQHLQYWQNIYLFSTGFYYWLKFTNNFVSNSSCLTLFCIESLPSSYFIVRYLWITKYP